MNRYKNEITVRLGARDYRLRPTYQSFADIEAETGITFMELVRLSAESNIPVTAMEAILTAGLRASGDTFDRDMLQEDIAAAGLRDTLSQIVDFFAIALNGAPPAGDSEKKS